MLGYLAKPTKRAVDEKRTDVEVRLRFGYHLGDAFVPEAGDDCLIISTLSSKDGTNYMLSVDNDLSIEAGEALEFSTKPEGYLDVYTYLTDGRIGA